ncbi:MAG: hypothetical protein IKL25_08430 [Clostridia bacterium]|nr:hypothetical protein [Clostridia bacterium]
MKRKFSVALVVTLLLLTLTGTAVAATYRGVTHFLTDNDYDRHYVMNPLRSYHTSHRLIVRVVDAHWDGAKLSVAYHIQSLDPNEIVAMRCTYPAHNHYASQANAGIIVEQPPYIIITESENVHHTAGYMIDWVCEEDSSLTVMITFQENALSDQLDFTIPVINVRDGNNPETAYLHFELPSLPDPIAQHTHDWEPATCVSPKVCRICGRTDGGLGKHDFTEATCISPETCRVCTVTSGPLSRHHQYGDDGYCILCHKYYEHADNTK